MTDLNPLLLQRLRAHISERHPNHAGLMQLAYDVLDDETDYEHVLTFLEESPSAVHRDLSRAGRHLFRELLTERLQDAVSEYGAIPNTLYHALLDLHAIDGFPERLSGLISLNYDGFLEAAISATGRHRIEWGTAIEGAEMGGVGTPLPLLKLHGSFEWTDCFPIRGRELNDASLPLWIPPGVVKGKQRYPFNVLWGRVRELLNCDILRVVGWNMGPNDWELISLLFSTKHGNDSRSSFRVELIASPLTATRLQVQFPYLDIKSILETSRAGEQLIAEYLQRSPISFERLDPDERERVVKAAGRRKNWFLDWLKRNLEWAHINLEVSTELTAATRVLEEVA